jgi:hypothetical protein
MMYLYLFQYSCTYPRSTGASQKKKKKRTKYNVDIITMCTKVRRAFYIKVEQEDLAGSKMAGSRYFRPLAPTAL